MSLPPDPATSPFCPPPPAVFTTRHFTVRDPPLLRFTSSKSARKSGSPENCVLAITFWAPIGAPAGALEELLDELAGVAACCKPPDCAPAAGFAVSAAGSDFEHPAKINNSTAQLDQ